MGVCDPACVGRSLFACHLRQERGPCAQVYRCDTDIRDNAFRGTCPRALPNAALFVLVGCLPRCVSRRRRCCMRCLSGPPIDVGARTLCVAMVGLPPSRCVCSLGYVSVPSPPCAVKMHILSRPGGERQCIRKAATDQELRDTTHMVNQEKIR